MLQSGRARVEVFLEHREAIMLEMSRRLFPQLQNEAERAEGRSRVKLLFNLLDMDGGLDTWYESETEAGDTFRSLMAANANISRMRVTIRDEHGDPTGQEFDMGAYVGEQPERTREAARRMPLALCLAKQLNEDWHRGQRHHERTLKSYLLQEGEGVSRVAKLAWCAQHGCTAINLQHDGVVVRLTDDWTAEAAEADLSRMATAACGYVQPVERKKWSAGIDFTDSLPARWVAPLAGMMGELSCEMVLKAQFDFLQSRGMVPRRWGGGNTVGKSATDEKETPWESFARNYTVPYLYGLIKTHKMPYGWRFISGGTNIALNLAGDWVHAALQAMIPDVHQLAASALAGAGTADPMPCNESFIIRDSRDVVRRIRELEVRRRAAQRAYTSGGGPRPQHHRRVQFEVADFTTLYPSLPHTDIMGALSALLARVFRAHRKDVAGGGTQPRFLRVSRGSKGVNEPSWVEGVRQRNGGYSAPKDDKNSGRHFDSEGLVAVIRFILGHTYMTVGDEVYRQVCGVPMGLSCSPMIAVMMLAHYEVTMLERMRDSVQQPLGSAVDTPRGRRPLTAELRDQHLDLAARLSRCCRAIDDVLLIDMTPAERRWAVKTMYPPSLELKTVCKSPERILYLDLEIKHDRGGFHCVLYDKRDALRDEGRMDTVRRFPHPSSVLSEQCRYACLTSFLHRASRCDMRTKAFVAHAAARMVEMFVDGYDGSKLVLKLRAFMRRYHRPQYRQRAVCAQVERAFERAAACTESAANVELFPSGTPMAVKGKRASETASAARKPQAAAGAAEPRDGAATPVDTELLSAFRTADETAEPRSGATTPVDVELLSALQRSTADERVRRVMQEVLFCHRGATPRLGNVLQVPMEVNPPAAGAAADHVMSLVGLMDRLDRTGYAVHVRPDAPATMAGLWCEDGVLKPSGIWYARGAAWLRFLTTDWPEELDNSVFVYALPLSPTPLLELSCGEDTRDLIDSFGVRDGTSIDWTALTGCFHGLHIEEFLDEFRHLDWYNSWAVGAAGVVWDPAALHEDAHVRGPLMMAVRMPDGRYFSKLDLEDGGVDVEPSQLRITQPEMEAARSGTPLAADDG